MIMIQFFSDFGKKDNSTKRPEGTVSLSLSGILKEPCSIMTPVIRIERLEQDANPCIYTYAIIPNFRRFYFVQDWIWVDGLWEVHMKEDVLASYRTTIGEQTEYVLRTDSTVFFDGTISDTAYPATTDIITHVYNLPNIFSSDIEVGCYIVGIISGGDTHAVGAVSYYAMSSDEFKVLKKKLFSDDNLEIMGIIDSGGQQLVTDLSQEVLKTLYNPYQYIASCMWFPFGKTAITSRTPQTAINIGWWEYPITGDLVYAQTVELGNESYLITAHPQASRGSYLNYAPYTRRTLIGRFGTVPIDTTCFEVGEYINVSYMIDLITGQCYARIAVRNESDVLPAEKLIAERNFLLGVPIQIAQVGTDYLGTAVNAIDTVSSAINLDFKGAAHGIYNTLASAMPQLETGGQNGSFLAPGNRTRIVEQFYQITNEDIHHRGRPLCTLKRLDTLSGFILCADGEIDINCLDAERTEILRYLTTGFFWE